MYVLRAYTHICNVTAQRIDHAVPANVGDTSPNTCVGLFLAADCLHLTLRLTGRLGAFCESPGQPWDGMPCDFNSSTCGGAAQDCHGRYAYSTLPSFV